MVRVIRRLRLSSSFSLVLNNNGLVWLRYPLSVLYVFKWSTEGTIFKTDYETQCILVRLFDSWNPLSCCYKPFSAYSTATGIVVNNKLYPIGTHFSNI